MVGDVVTFKVCSQHKLSNGFIGINHPIRHYSYNLPLVEKPQNNQLYGNY